MKQQHHGIFERLKTLKRCSACEVPGYACLPDMIVWQNAPSNQLKAARAREGLKILLGQAIGDRQRDKSSVA